MIVLCAAARRIEAGKGELTPGDGRVPEKGHWARPSSNVGKIRHLFLEKWITSVKAISPGSRVGYWILDIRYWIAAAVTAPSGHPSILPSLLVRT